MTTPDPFAKDPYGASAPPPAPSGYGQPAPGGYGQPVPGGYGQPDPAGWGQRPIGQVRGTWAVIGLSLVTFGIYTLFYYYRVHEDMKLHTGQGLGGGIALLLALFVGVASPFLLSDEVGKLYSHSGRQAPVSATTGLWYFPGIFILVGPFIWLFKTNGALNDYWRSVGAR